MTNINKCLKHALVEKGVTVTQIAEELGKNRKTIYSAFAKGNPTLKTVEEVANHLGYSLSQFTALDGG